MKKLLSLACLITMLFLFREDADAATFENARHLTISQTSNYAAYTARGLSGETWFSFDASVNAKISMNYSHHSQNSSGIYYLYLYDQNQNLIKAFETPMKQYNFMDYIATYSGKYYIKIKPIKSDTSQNFSLIIYQTFPLNSLDVDASNNIYDADEYTDSIYLSNVTWNNQNDMDWYKFNVSKDGLYSLSFGEYPIAGTQYVQVFSQDFELIKNVILATSQPSIKLLKGTYYICLSSYKEPDVTAPYTFNIHRIKSGFTSGEAFFLNRTPEFVQGLVDDRWYTFEADANQKIDISYLRQGSSVPSELYYVYLYDQNLNILESYYEQMDTFNSLAHITDYSGIYYIKIQPVVPNKNSQYKLSVSTVSDYDDYEVDDTKYTGTKYTDAIYLTDGTWDSKDDTDWKELIITTDGRYKVQYGIYPLATTVAQQYSIYDDNSRLVRQGLFASNTGRFKQEFDLKSGVYYICLNYAGNPDPTTPYSFTLELVSPAL